MSGPTRTHSQQGTPGRIVGPGAPAAPAPKGAECAEVPSVEPAGRIQENERLRSMFNAVWDQWLDAQKLEIGSAEQLFEILRKAIHDAPTKPAEPSAAELRSAKIAVIVQPGQTWRHRDGMERVVEKVTDIGVKWTSGGKLFFDQLDAEWAPVPTEPVCTCDGTQSVKTCLKCSQEHPSKKYVPAQPEPAKAAAYEETCACPQRSNDYEIHYGDCHAKPKPAKWVPGDKAEWVVGISHVVAGEIKAVWDEGAVFQAPGAAPAVVSFASGVLRRPLTTRKVCKQVECVSTRGHKAWLNWETVTDPDWTPTGRTHEFTVEVDE